MRLLAFVFAIGMALAAAAGDTKSLVDVAKASKEKKKKSTTKVITNADIKKSKGVVKENTSAVAPVEAAAPQTSLAEQQETSYRDRHAREAVLAVATQRVAALESELIAIEQSYYDENDLDKRDKDIVKRFEDVKAKLDVARKELAALAPSE